MDKKSGKQPLFASILVIVLAVLGYLGYPVFHETGQDQAVTTEQNAEKIAY